MRKIQVILLIISGSLMFNFFRASEDKSTQDKIGAHLKKLDYQKVDWKSKKAEYWQEVMTPLQYKVTRDHGTERAFTGKYNEEKRAGVFHCSSCGQKLFDMKTKFDSGTGWPSFFDIVPKENVKLTTDKSFGMSRTEVSCSRCGSHLGHVFEDGPKPTGLRYCINSVSLIHSEDIKGE